MRLPNFKRINTVDFPKEDQQLVEKLGESYNVGMDLVYQALSRRLTINDNLQAAERTVELQVDSNGKPKNDVFVNTDLGVPIRNIIVGKAENLTNSTGYPTGAPWITWDNTQNGIQIVNVKNLLASNTYRLRIVMFG